MFLYNFFTKDKQIKQISLALISRYLKSCLTWVTQIRISLNMASFQGNSKITLNVKQSYQPFSLLLHCAQQLRELLQGLSCKISSIPQLWKHSSYLTFCSLHSSSRKIWLTNVDLIICLSISNTFKLELLQRLREALNSKRKT